VQLGPGQDVGSLAEDITSGRYVASDLDRWVGGVPSLSHFMFRPCTATIDSSGRQNAQCP